jgi:hypothetical protein
MSIVPVLNTKNTDNIFMYADALKQVGMYFGYCNVDEELSKTHNMFITGRNNGIFFVLNDKNTHNRVQSFISKNMSTEIIKLGSVAEGLIDIYMSVHLHKKVSLDILNALQQVVNTIEAIPSDTIQTPEIQKQPFSISMRDGSTNVKLNRHITLKDSQHLFIYGRVMENSSIMSMQPPPYFTETKTDNLYITESRISNRYAKFELYSTFSFQCKEYGESIITLYNKALPATLYFIFALDKPSPIWKACTIPLDGIYFLINISPANVSDQLIEVKSIDNGKIVVLVTEKLKDYISWTWLADS